MNNANITCIAVGKNRYAVDKLNPMEAFEWGPRALSLFGPSLGKIVASLEVDKLSDLKLESMGLTEIAASLQKLLAMSMSSCGELKSAEVVALLREAVQRCYTPHNESLADMAVFNRWFQEHPGDLFPLGGMALVYLVKDFFPSQLVTAASAFLTKKSTTAGTASTSPRDGKDAPL